MELFCIEVLRDSIDKTQEWLELHKNETHYNKYYFYYTVKNPFLSCQIRKDFFKWKKMCEEISCDKYTLVRESDVTNDTDDYNFFVIIKINIAKTTHHLQTSNMISN